MRGSGTWRETALTSQTTTKSTQLLKAAAVELGFGLTGACAAVSPGGFQPLQQWIDAGHVGQLDYIPKRMEAYRHPDRVMPGVVSLLMLGMNYRTAMPAEQARPGFGQVSRYAWGDSDYHDLVWSKLNELGERASRIWPGLKWRGVIDTAPLLEREFASLAGIGWQAKNTMLINPKSGSWFFLAALLMDVELEYDDPLTTNHCGSCTACLDACPTDAFVEPHVLDARRCISYLTIELKEQIPREFRAGMGDLVFGCDICQEVCPWNRFSSQTSEAALQPSQPDGEIDLREMFFWSDEQFRSRFRKTALWRPRRRGMLRNAAIVLGNQKDADSIPALTAGLNEAESIVRGASAWALGELGTPECHDLLKERLKIEQDADVQKEIILVIESSHSRVSGPE